MEFMRYRTIFRDLQRSQRRIELLPERKKQDWKLRRRSSSNAAWHLLPSVKCLEESKRSCEIYFPLTRSTKHLWVCALIYYARKALTTLLQVWSMYKVVQRGERQLFSCLSRWSLNRKGVGGAIAVCVTINPRGPHKRDSVGGKHPD